MEYNDGVSTMPVPWKRLKAWIDAQEKAEQSGYNPNPPTTAQIAALSHIVDFLDEPEPTAETIGKSDYVSELMQFAQREGIVLPKFRDLPPIDVPFSGVFSQRFRTVCTIPYFNNKEFPCVGHGLKEGKQPPLWKSKKLSKQYAAKCAYKYIKANFGASTSSNSRAPVAAMNAPPARNPTPSNNNSNNNNNNNASTGSYSSARAQALSGGAPLSMAPPSSMLPSPSSSAGDLTTVEDTDYYDSKVLPSLLDQVKTETAYLKLGYPNFEIWPDPDTPGLWAGKPIFKHQGRIPEDMGLVKGALNRALAKELMAEEVLKYCKAERKWKEGAFGSFKG